jgi:hypothetical protein
VAYADEITAILERLEDENPYNTEAGADLITEGETVQ